MYAPGVHLPTQTAQPMKNAGSLNTTSVSTHVPTCTTVEYFSSFWVCRRSAAEALLALVWPSQDFEGKLAQLAHSPDRTHVHSTVADAPPVPKQGGSTIPITFVNGGGSLQQRDGIGHCGESTIRKYRASARIPSISWHDRLAGIVEGF